MGALGFGDLKYLLIVSAVYVVAILVYNYYKPKSKKE